MGEKIKVEKTMATTIVFFAAFSVILSVLMIVNISDILTLLQIPVASFDEACQYIFICRLGIFFIC